MNASKIKLTSSLMTIWLLISMMLCENKAMAQAGLGLQVDNKPICISRQEAQDCLIDSQMISDMQERLNTGCGGQGYPCAYSFWSSVPGKITLVLIGAAAFKIGETVIK